MLQISLLTHLINQPFVDHVIFRVWKKNENITNILAGKKCQLASLEMNDLINCGHYYWRLEYQCKILSVH